MVTDTQTNTQTGAITITAPQISVQCKYPTKSQTDELQNMHISFSIVIVLGNYCISQNAGENEKAAIPSTFKLRMN